MHIAHASTAPSHRTLRRVAYGVLAAVLLGATIAAIGARGSGWWWFAGFVMAPDIALFAGLGTGLEKGQLHPRGVRLYNALHSFWAPAVLAVASFALPGAVLIVALTWTFHIAWDRLLGYDLRTPDGFQRS